MRGPVATLEWIGARARWVLAAGVVAAMLMPAVSAFLRPLLPGLVVLIFTVAMARMELGEVARAAVRPRRLLRLAVATLGLLVATPIAFWMAGRVLGLPDEALAALVYTGAAPPITSAAALCLILGFNAVFALEVTVLASLATPVLGPLVATLLLGEAVPIDGVALALRVGAMVGAGVVAALALRRVLGPARIRARAKTFDGVATLVMILFVIPLFDGFWTLVTEDAQRALLAAALALAANTAVTLGLIAVLRRPAGRAGAGAAGVVWGNRTVALYLAALPAEPFFTLFVALYQIPMLFTPLIVERVFGRQPDETERRL